MQHPAGQEQDHVALPGQQGQIGPEIDDSCLNDHHAPADGDTTKTI